MFNIIETLRNYFIRELLHDNLSSDVALHFNVSYWRPHLVVSCSEEVCRRPVRLLWKNLRYRNSGNVFGIIQDQPPGKGQGQCQYSVQNSHRGLFKDMAKSSESVQWPITGPCLRMRHRPSAQHTVPIRKICLRWLTNILRHALR